MNLDGKVAVITGAASGMGRAMAVRFCAAGAAVVGGDVDQAGLDQLATEIAATGGQFIGQRCDVSRRDDADALIARAVEAFGGLDALVNNAGIMDHFEGIGEVSDEMMERVLRVNLYGPLYLSRAAIGPMLQRGGGAIVNVGSIANFSGAPAGAVYTASKHALLGLTQSTAWQYAPRNIRCNAIAPGSVPTNIARNIPPAVMESAGFQRALPFMGCLPRTVTAEDVANLAAFLVSDLACNISGALVPVDGGWNTV